MFINITLCFFCSTFAVQITLELNFSISHLIYIYKNGYHLIQHLHRQMGDKNFLFQISSARFFCLFFVLIEIHYDFCYVRGCVSENHDLRANHLCFMLFVLIFTQKNCFRSSSCSAFVVEQHYCCITNYH